MGLNAVGTHNVVLLLLIIHLHLGVGPSAHVVPGCRPFGPWPTSGMYMYSQAAARHHTTHLSYLLSEVEEES